MCAKLVTMEEENVSSFPGDDVTHRDAHCEVRDPAAVRVLMDRNQVQLLRPFFDAEMTVSEAAERLELPLQFLYRKVVRFEKLGLLVVTRTEKRKGRGIRHYRTPAAQFYVPAQAIDMGLLLKRSEDYWQRRLKDGLLAVWNRRREGGLGVKVAPNTIGGVRISLASAPGVPWRALDESEPAMLNSWLRLNLSFQDAKALQREMTTLLERYTDKHRPGGEATHIARFALAPLVEE